MNDNLLTIILALVFTSWLWIPLLIALVVAFFRGATDVVLAFRGQRAEQEGDRG